MRRRRKDYELKIMKNFNFSDIYHLVRHSYPVANPKEFEYEIIFSSNSKEEVKTQLRDVTSIVRQIREMALSAADYEGCDGDYKDIKCIYDPEEELSSNLVYFAYTEKINGKLIRTIYDIIMGRAKI